MATLGQINVGETLNAFRDRIEALSGVSPLVHPLGRSGLEAYFRALAGIVSHKFEGQTRQQQIMKDLSQPDCITVEYRATKQKVSMCAAVLGRTAATATSFAIGVEYECGDMGDTSKPSPSVLSTKLSYIGPNNSYAYIANWWPPFELPETDAIDPAVSAAVRAKYDGGFDMVLSAVQQFNTMLTPVVEEVEPNYLAE